MRKWKRDEGGTGRCGVWKGEMGVLGKLVFFKKKEKIYRRPRRHIQMCCLGCWRGRGWCWWGREWRDRQWQRHQLWAPGMWMCDVGGEWHCQQWWVLLLVVSLRWKYQYIKKQQLNLKKKLTISQNNTSGHHFGCWHANVWCGRWVALSAAVGVVIGGVSEVAVSVEIKITIKLKKNLPDA